MELTLQSVIHLDVGQEAQLQKDCGVMVWMTVVMEVMSRVAFGYVCYFPAIKILFHLQCLDHCLNLSLFSSELCYHCSHNGLFAVWPPISYCCGVHMPLVQSQPERSWW